MMVADGTLDGTLEEEEEEGLKTIYCQWSERIQVAAL